jgi:diguanylate cyclase (GGDEF)-like protein/PAS domain S-box-containing protein
MQDYFQKLGLKTKIAAAALALVIGAIWLEAGDVAKVVRDDLRQVLAAEQLALVEHIADSLDQDARLRFDTLGNIATGLGADQAREPQRIHGQLAKFGPLQTLFNRGITVIGPDGHGLADFPAIEGRGDSDFRQSDVFQEVMATGQPAVGRGRVSRFSHQPVVVLGVPVLDGTGKPVGAVIGTNSLTDADFFTEIIPHSKRLGGDFHILSPRDRLVLVSTDPSRVLTPLPPPGADSRLDALLRGGSGVLRSATGEEMLVSAAIIPATGWVMQSAIPASVAFAAIARLEQTVYTDAIISSLGIAVLLWGLLYRLLLPLSRATTAVTDMAEGRREPAPLAEEGSPEIRRLIASVNTLYRRLDAQQRRLKENAEAMALAASVFDGTSEAILITGPDNRIVEVNRPFCRLTGYERDELIGHSPSLLKSGRHDPAFYAAMWRELEERGEWSGEIWNRRKSGEIYPERLTISTIRDETGQVARRIAIAADITVQKQSESLIWRQANHDLLTELPNRKRFLELLEAEVTQAVQSGRPLWVALINLDHFKEINERLGHQAADAMLVETAIRIRLACAAGDVVASLGGDEFILALAGENGATRVDAVRQALAAPYRLAAEIVQMTASIGLIQVPKDGTSAEDIMRNVGLALMDAKGKGRNRVGHFSDAMRKASDNRLALAADLRGALAAGQFETYFQPILDMKSRQVVKAEALLRWKHPERGFVSPAHFIPVAEEMGLISEIGDWVFREAAAMAKTWCDLWPCPTQDHCGPAGARACPFQISVNKSPRQFYTGLTHHDWLEHLAEQGICPQSLSIEITEGLLLDQRGEVVEKLRNFRDAGVKIAIDDFGTGYSAMSYLKRFDVDYLKIDQSFVRDITSDPGDLAVAQAIIAMAHALDIKTIAEGIETEEQYALLAEAGCDFGQGYLFARPLPAADFIRLIGSNAPADMPLLAPSLIITES